jgi:regulator of replication initiation timing
MSKQPKPHFRTDALATSFLPPPFVLTTPVQYYKLSLDSPPTKDQGDSDLESLIPEEKTVEMRRAGSFNPFQGATRRIVSLRQKIGSIQQQIVDVHNETLELDRERERLRTQLEQRPPPIDERFRHEKPISLFKQKKQSITLKKYTKYCEELLKREKSPKDHDELICIHDLLKRMILVLLISCKGYWTVISDRTTLKSWQIFLKIEEPKHLF